MQKYWAIFLQFSTDEFRGIANDIFKLCKKDFLLGYICISLEDAKQLVLSVTRSPSSSPGKGCGLEHAAGHVLQQAALAAMPAASHGGCSACMAFVPWPISLCPPALLTDFPSTWQHTEECWFSQSHQYFVCKETYIIEAFQIWILGLQAR